MMDNNGIINCKLSERSNDSQSALSGHIQVPNDGIYSKEVKLFKNSKTQAVNSPRKSDIAIN